MPQIPPIDSSGAAAQPLMNPKYRHISRSAAKRESVQLLGSIKDLQRHFAQAATIEHRPGAGVGVRGLDTLGEEEENRDPQQAVAGPSKERRPWKEVELTRIDVGAARKEVRETVVELRLLWSLPGSPPGSSSSSPVSASPTSVDTRQVLIRTARAIRRVREITLAMGPGGRKVSGTLPRIKQGRTSISTPSRPAVPLPRAVSGSATLPPRTSSLGASASEQAMSDEYAELRRAALDVLGGLRGMEERLRLTPEAPDGNRAPSSTRSVSSSDVISRPASSMSGLTSEPESITEQEQEEWNMNLLAADGDLQRHIQTWEERIASEGKEYQEWADAAGKEKEAVRKWIVLVERIFRPDGEGEARGQWMTRDWSDSAARVHDFLISHLPLSLQLLLPSSERPDLRGALLARLSDGFILIQALNSALQLSTRSWGYVPDEDIHDTLQPSEASASGSHAPAAGEERGVEGWTFRRIGNLTAWAAALRHRYNLPVVLPSRTSQSAFLTMPPTRQPRRPSVEEPSQQTAPRSGDEAINFDPAQVAKREPGWEDGLERLALRWISEVAAEMAEGI